ncbi:hypothetical protein Salat_1126000 [Sesamum alatum]|uniref:Endonuclease/exonuclease/phosphatase domain-containing protein n=1 Tax=Sesamum alatum TaxID=300844 RepID=A0AAE1YDU8_9LAMI|nr:hypothetical protein Salat_1126000 [Sesamum alatum]
MGVQQPDIPTIGKDEQEWPGPPRPQPSMNEEEQPMQKAPRQTAAEAHSSAGSSGSSNEPDTPTSTQHFMPGTIEFWNMRGFNRPLKHNGVTYLIKNNQLCLLGILETKLVAPAIPRILNQSFSGWCQINIFGTIDGGHIFVIWNPTLILGDFNFVKSPGEKQLGVSPTWYELKDFANCCLTVGLRDAPTTGRYYTSYSNNDSNPIRCKLDRVLLNNEWLKAELHCGTHFSPPGCLSDHSPDIVSILDLPAPKPKPFWFLNMWADHPDFIATVEDGWSLNVEGTPQFSICRKLKAFKRTLKAFNNLHFSHIFIRAKEVDLALQDAQLQLESDLGNAALRDSLGDLRKKVFKNNELSSILARTEFARGERHVRYLGISFATQQLSVTDFSPLVDRIANCISKWTAKSLTFAGQLELIRSIIQGAECF